jgi:hypothetical protein
MNKNHRMMKKKLICKYLFILISVSALFCCQERDIDKYENDPRLYFYRSSDTEQRDSISFSFFIQTGTPQTELSLQLRTMGLPSTEKRYFRVKQTNIGGTDAAIPGVHYVSFDDATYQSSLVVEPNAITATLPIILIRDISLQSREVRLEITIEENSYFKPGIASNDHFLIKISDFIVKPSSWDKWYGTLGTWGPQRMLFLIRYLGLDFSIDPNMDDYNHIQYIVGLAKEALTLYNNTHDEPLQEADGTLISF